MCIGKGSQCLLYSLYIPLYQIYTSYTPQFRPGSEAHVSIPWWEHEPIGASLHLRGRQQEDGAKTPIVHMGGRIAHQTLPVQVHVVVNSSRSLPRTDDRAAYTSIHNKVTSHFQRLDNVMSHQGMELSVQDVLGPEDKVSGSKLTETTFLRGKSGMSGRELSETIPDIVEMSGSKLTETISTIPTYLRVPASGRELSETAVHTTFHHKLRILTYILPCIAVMCYIAHMVTPGGGEGSQVSYRVPPGWSPEREGSGYSFRNYITDLTLWIMLTDLAPHQQAAAIIMRLGGAAREMARTITPQEIINAGPSFVHHTRSAHPICPTWRGKSTRGHDRDDDLPAPT